MPLRDYFKGYWLSIEHKTFNWLGFFTYLNQMIIISCSPLSNISVEKTRARHNDFEHDRLSSSNHSTTQSNELESQAEDW